MKFQDTKDRGDPLHLSLVFFPLSYFTFLCHLVLFWDFLNLPWWTFYAILKIASLTYKLYVFKVCNFCRYLHPWSIITIKRINVSVIFKSFLLALPSHSSLIPFPVPKQPLTCFLSVKTNLLFSRTLQKWNYKACTPYHPPSLTQHNILRSIHHIRFIMLTVHSFLFLSSVPLYGYTIIC